MRRLVNKFIIDAPNHLNMKNLSIMLELYQSLAKTGKSITFYLIDRLILLILSLSFLRLK